MVHDKKGNMLGKLYSAGLELSHVGISRNQETVLT